jgi:hypothetical protein
MKFRYYIKALGDYILDVLSDKGVYTHFLFGALTTRIDTVAQVIVVLLFSLYVSLRSKSNPEAVQGLAQFTAGYFLASLGYQIAA